MRERRHSSETRKLERAELSRLQQAAASEPVSPVVMPEGSTGRRAMGSQPPQTKPATGFVESEMPLRARAETLHDPMTMALLAEVERTTPVTDGDSDDDPAGFDTPAMSESIHPHVVRR